MSISSHYQQPQSKGWCSFSMCSDSSLSSPCKDLYPHWFGGGTHVLGDPGQARLAPGAVSHLSRLSSSLAHLPIPSGALWCSRQGLHTEGSGWFSSASPQPLCSSTRGPREQGWSHCVLLTPWVVLAVLSSSSSMVFGGLTGCFH